MPLLRLLSAAILAFGLLNAGSLLAADAAAELLRLSGVEAQMQGLRPQILDGLESGEFALEPDDLALLRPVINREFADAELREQSLRILRESWQEGHAAATLSWLGSETGRRITLLEEYASTAEGAEEMQGFAAELTAAPPRPGRVALLNRLNQAFDGTRLAVDTTLAMALAVAVAANAAQPEDQQLSGQSLRAGINEGRPVLTRQMQKLLVVYYLFTYHELSDTEVAAYADFLESEDGSWYVNSMSAAYLQPLMAQALGLDAAVREAAGSRSD